MTVTTRSSRSAQGQGSTAEKKQEADKGGRSGWRVVCETWVDSRLTICPGVSTPVSELYNTYIAENPNDYMDIGQFGKILQSRFRNSKCRRGKQGEQIYVYQNVAVKKQQGATNQSITRDIQDCTSGAIPRKSPNSYEGFTAHSRDQSPSLSHSSKKLSAVSRKVLQEQSDGSSEYSSRDCPESSVSSKEMYDECASALSQTNANTIIHGPKRKFLGDQNEAVPLKKDKTSVEDTSFSELTCIIKEEPAIKEEPEEEEYELTLFDAIPLHTLPTAALDNLSLSYTASISPNCHFHVFPPDCTTSAQSLCNATQQSPFHFTGQLQISPHHADEINFSCPSPGQASNHISPENHSTFCSLPLHQSGNVSDSHIPSINPKHLPLSLDHNEPQISSSDHIINPSTKVSHHSSPSKTPGFQDSELQKDLTLTSKPNYRMALARRWVDANLIHQDGARIGADEIWEAYINDNPTEPLSATSMAIIIRGKYPNRRKAYREDKRECFYYQDLVLVKNQFFSQSVQNKTYDKEEEAIQPSNERINASNQCFTEEKEFNQTSLQNEKTVKKSFGMERKEAHETSDEKNIVQATQSADGKEIVSSQTFGKTDRTVKKKAAVHTSFLEKEDLINLTKVRERLDFNVNSNDGSGDDTNLCNNEMLNMSTNTDSGMHVISTVDSVAISVEEGKTLPCQAKEKGKVTLINIDEEMDADRVIEKVKETEADTTFVLTQKDTNVPIAVSNPPEKCVFNYQGVPCVVVAPNCKSGSDEKTGPVLDMKSFIEKLSAEKTVVLKSSKLLPVLNDEKSEVSCLDSFGLEAESVGSLQEDLRTPSVGISPQVQLHSVENERATYGCSSEIHSKLNKSVCTLSEDCTVSPAADNGVRRMSESVKKQMSQESCVQSQLLRSKFPNSPENTTTCSVPDTAESNIHVLCRKKLQNSNIDLEGSQKDSSHVTALSSDYQYVQEPIEAEDKIPLGRNEKHGVVELQSDNSTQNNLDVRETHHNKDILLPSGECEPGMTVMDYIMSEMTDEQTEISGVDATSRKQSSQSHSSVESELLFTSNCLDRSLATSCDVQHLEVRCPSNNVDNGSISDKDMSLYSTRSNDALPHPLPAEVLSNTTLPVGYEKTDNNNSVSVSNDNSKSSDDKGKAESNPESLPRQSQKKRKKSMDGSKGKTVDCTTGKKTDISKGKMINCNEDKNADSTEIKKDDSTEGKSKINKKLKSWDEDIRRYISSDEHDWYQVYLSSKANKKASEKERAGSGTALPVKVKKIKIGPNPVSLSFRIRDRQNCESVPDLNTRIHKLHGNVAGTSSACRTDQPEMEAQTHSDGSKLDRDVEIVSEVVTVSKSDRDLEIVNEVVNVNSVDKIEAKSEKESRYAKGSKVVGKKIKCYENSCNKHCNNIITGRAVKPWRVLDTEESKCGDEDIDSIMREIKTTVKAVKIVAKNHRNNAIETVSDTHTSKTIETMTDKLRGSTAESMTDITETVAEKNNSDKSVKGPNNETRGDGNISDGDSSKSLVIDLDTSDSVESTNSHSQNKSDSNIANPATIQTVHVSEDVSRMQGKCIQIIMKGNSGRVDTIEKDKETQKQNVDECSQDYFNLSGSASVENVAVSRTESKVVKPTAERIQESVLRAALDIMSNKELGLNMVERSKRLESALLWSNPAVRYISYSNKDQDQTLCVSSSSLEEIKSLPPDEITSLLQHHQCCPGLGCSRCHILRAAYIHITLFRHRCHVWCSFAAIVKKHAETCWKLLCPVLFCHFVKHMLHVNGTLVKGTQPLMLREFSRCHALGPHGTNFMCNHHARLRLPLQGKDSSSLANDVKLMIQLMQSKYASHVDFIEPVYETFHIAASEKNANIKTV